MKQREISMHDYQHDHKGSSSNRIGWAFFLNVSFTIIEFVGGLLTNSTAIMADAVHDLGDSLSIGLAWLLSKLGSKEPNGLFTYGYQRFSLLGALINGLVLIAGSLWVLNTAIPRLFEPQQPHAVGMFWLAILGVVVNGYAAFKLSHGKTLNERVLNWHLMEDVLGWVAVLIVAVTLMFVDWPILDPLLSIAFTLFILVNVVRRKTDTPGDIHFQADRIHNLNGSWYFLTRKGGNIGPFETKRQAERSLALFLSGVRDDSSD